MKIKLRMQNIFGQQQNNTTFSSNVSLPIHIYQSVYICEYFCQAGIIQLIIEEEFCPDSQLHKHSLVPDFL